MTRRLANILNASLVIRFLIKIKHIIVTVINKPKKQHRNVENHRPISLLDVPEKIKIFETILNVSCNILMKTTSLTADNMGDVSKAFDKIWYQGLRYRLLEINITDHMFKFLGNFLHKRTAKIKLRNYIFCTTPTSLYHQFALLYMLYRWYNANYNPLQ